MRIAYVEDNPTNQALVARIASMNHHVIVAYSEGEIAQIELMEEKFDLILMDVELAGEINGLQVVRHLRAHGLRTPIIAVTAYAMMGDRDKCLEAGCDDYLPKPLPITSLLQLLDRYDKLSIKNEEVIPASSVAAAAQPAPDAPSVTSAPATATPDTSATAAATAPQESAAPPPAKPSEPSLPTPGMTQVPENKTPVFQKDTEMAPTLPASSAEPPVSSNGAIEPKLPNEGKSS